MQHWPISRAYFWEKAPFFRILIPFIAGIICYDRFAIFNNIHAVTSFTVAAFAVGFLLLSKKKLSISVARKINSSAIFVSLFFIALIISFAHDDRQKSDCFAHQMVTAEAWKVQVIAPPQEKEKTRKLKVSVQNALCGDSSNIVSGKAFLYLYKDSSFNVHENDQLIIPNHFQPVKNAGNPFEMDYARFAARDNFYFQQFLSLHDVVLLPDHSKPGLLAQIHQFSLNQLARFIKDKPTLTLLQAMLVGEDNALDEDTRQAYSQTGIIHIVSISGSHVVLLFYIICALFA
ncbi:hypothetical protein DN068_09335 [Taibaiella soli]|uniref:ComEC/Rec2-related protein domain-containing protein n=1 Tax=Taibaiella soli TaxID=1649169 RepID=A0A2W2BHT3_9BACT|nr:hypothetical protein DN068_09335 [Taibaiella soli]